MPKGDGHVLLLSTGPIEYFLTVNGKFVIFNRNMCYYCISSGAVRSFRSTSIIGVGPGYEIPIISPLYGCNWQELSDGMRVHVSYLLSKIYRISHVRADNSPQVYRQIKTRGCYNG